MCGGAIISDYIEFKAARRVAQSDLWSSEFDNRADSFESSGSKPQPQQGEQAKDYHLRFFFFLGEFYSFVHAFISSILGIKACFFKLYQFSSRINVF